jgi:hypothetical protein
MTEPLRSVWEFYTNRPGMILPTLILLVVAAVILYTLVDLRSLAGKAERSDKSFQIKEVVTKWAGFWIGLSDEQMDQLDLRPEMFVLVSADNAIQMARIRRTNPEGVRSRYKEVVVSPALAEALVRNKGQLVQVKPLSQT